MRISSILYSMKQGLINIWRNKLFSSASIATMTACIFLFGLFYSIVANFQSMVKNVEEGVAITVFFEEDVSEEQIQAIGAAIGVAPGVLDKDYVSADEAWEEFKAAYFTGENGEEMTELTEAFSENPLADSFNYRVRVRMNADTQAVRDRISQLPGVRQVTTVREAERAGGVK